MHDGSFKVHNRKRPSRNFQQKFLLPWRLILTEHTVNDEKPSVRVFRKAQPHCFLSAVRASHQSEVVENYLKNSVRQTANVMIRIAFIMRWSRSEREFATRSVTKHYACTTEYSMYNLVCKILSILKLSEGRICLRIKTVLTKFKVPILQPSAEDV